MTRPSLSLDPVILLATTMDSSSDKSYALAAGSTFTQRFRAKASGTPVNLVIRMGNNQNPYSARVCLTCNDRIIFDGTFQNRVQRTSDWGTVFELDGMQVKVLAGDWLQFAITPDTSIGIEPLFMDDPDFPSGELPNYGQMVARFCLEGSKASATDPANPIIRLLPAAPPSPAGMGLQDWSSVTYPVGIQIVAEAENTQDEYVVNAVWDFTDPVVVLSAYTQTLPLGQAIPLITNQGKRLPFYVFEASPPQFPYTFSVDITLRNRQNHDRTVTMDGSFPVTAPTFAGLTPKPCTGVRINVGPNNIRYLQFGNPWPGPNQRPGVWFKARVNAAGRARLGQIAVIQLLKLNNAFTKSDGTVVTATTNGQWFCDRSIPYSGSLANFNGAGVAELSFNDSPGLGLRPNCTAVSADETFRAYIVYKSNEPDIPSVWIALGYIEWFWRASISRADTNAPWPTEPTNPQYSSVLNLQFVPEPGVFSWVGNVSMCDGAVNALGVVPDIPGIYWIDHAAEARQMEVRFNGANSPEFVAALSTALATPLGLFMNVPQSYQLWTTPDNARNALNVAGVTGVYELEVARRYVQARNPHDYQILSTWKKFDVNVAPQCYYRSDPANFQWAAGVAPGLPDVAAALLDIAQRNGITNMAATPRDPHFVRLTFANPPTPAMLAALAAHPQVFFIEMAPDERSDDPDNPRR